MTLRIWLFLLVAAFGALASAQEPPPSTSQPAPASKPYVPAVPPPSMYGGYGGYGGNGYASTAAQGAMQGMASVISAKGDYNLSTSAAAINLTQAQSQAIQNRQQATDAYFSMRQTNRQMRAQEAGPKPTEQQLVRIAHEGVPRPLGPTEMDPVTGALLWPGFLQTAEFAAQRKVMDDLFAKRANGGALSYADQTTARNTVSAMFGELKQHIRDLPPPDYVACRSFLNSLTYAAAKNEI